MKQWAGLALGLALVMAPALAQDESGASSYAGGGLLYELPDSARDSDNGLGLHLHFGLPLSGRPGEALEFSLHSLERDRDSGSSDRQTALFANYLKGFGLFGWDQSEGIESVLPAFTPYVLAGIGVAQDEGPAGDGVVPALDAGAGLSFPLSYRGWSIRTEALVLGQINDKSVASEDFLLDYQFRIGLSIPLGWSAPSEAELPPPRECGIAVVDPLTGRSDCSVDSDRDGVTDVADLCPGTLPGTPVDANGCAALNATDSDGDGVDDNADDCPGTPRGEAVDDKGCATGGSRAGGYAGPVPVAPYADTGLAPTLPATPVTEPGGRVVRLDRVLFAKASADLTPEAKDVLDQAAANLGANTELVVELAGHTDGEGSSQYNQMLSLLRANNVRKYLVGKGVNRYRLYVEGYGETKPAESNDTEAGRAQNRRVDLDEVDVKVQSK